MDMYMAVEAEATEEQLIAAVEAAGLLRRYEYLDNEVQMLHRYTDDGEEIVGSGAPIIAYWRKANAIHGWIVRNVADGVDECQRIPMSREVLRDLVLRCKRVLLEFAASGEIEEAAKREDLAPTGGFFFGSYDMDEWYRQDLEETIEQIEKMLNAKELESASFFYQASW